MSEPPPASADVSPALGPPLLQPAQPDSLRDLRVEFAEQGHRLAEIEGDLRAAEEQIHRLEAELRVRNARITELQRLREPLAQDDAAAAASTGAQPPVLATTPNLTALLAAADAADAAEHALRNATDRRGRQADGQALAMAATPSAEPAANANHAPEGVARFLVMLDGDTELVHLLGRRTTLGRGPDNDIQIDQQFVSRHHAIIVAGPQQTVIEDLRSTNGLLVNGQRVRRCALNDGDVVLIGKTQFRFARRRS